MAEEFTVYWAALRPNEDGSRPALGLIPAVSGSYSHILNKPGAFSVTIPLTYTPGGFSLNDIAPGKTLVVIERYGTPVYAGILWGISANMGSNTATLNGLGILSYFRKRYLRIGKSFTSTEFVEIATWLIDKAQESSGNIGVDTSSLTNTGQTGTRRYYSYELNEIGKLLESLNALHRGFDLRFTVTKNTMGYQLAASNTPSRLGRPTNLVFDPDRGATSFNLDINASDMANSVVLTGSGEGSERIDGKAIDTAPTNVGYPVLESVTGATSDKLSQRGLNNHADAQLRAVSTPLYVPSLTLLADAEPGLGSYYVGDQAAVRVNHDILSYAEDCKILQIAVSFETGKNTSASVSFIPLANL